MSDLRNERENWGSRAGFVLAAIGSAVGLGNIWRFPHEAYSNGGSAFLIPYMIAMIVIGIPLLIMEFSLGHLTQQAAPGAFRKVSRKWEFVGWWPIVLSFIIVCYYSTVLAWCLNYLIHSFKSPLPWGENAAVFFDQTHLGNTHSFKLGGLQWPIAGALIIIWMLMFLCIFKGVKIVSKIVLWTVPLPWLMLVILTIRGVTLDGAIQGLEYYLEPNWEVLKEPSVWRAAFGQVFFSMTIAFGVMITYASFLHRKSDLNNNALIIGLADLGTSFIAGIAVFSTMGALALKTGQPVESVLEGSQSVGLAFVAFPEALSQLPWWPNFFAVIFFIALLLLGIDSAFSITEAALASMIDKTGRKRITVLAIMSIVGLTSGLLFSTRGGINWLGTIDGYINEGTWGIMFVGLIECLILGWYYDLGKLRDHTNKNSDWKIGVWWEWAIRLVIPVILGALVTWSLVGDIIGSPLKLDSHDIQNSSAIAQRMVDNQLPPNIVTQLDQSLIGELKKADASVDLSDELIEKMTDQLNGLIEGDSLYNKSSLATTPLSDDTLYLISESENENIKADTIRLNRWILQDIFPTEIAKSDNQGGFFVNFKGQLIGTNILGMSMTFIIFLFAVILSLWNPSKNATIVEFDT